MASLITTIEQLRKYVKLSYNVKDVQTLPDFEMPQWVYLKPILGKTLYDALVATPTNPDYATLLEFARAVIAPTAIFHALPTTQALITDMGLKTMSSDTMQAAHRWEYKEVREELQNKAGFAAERLIEYLIEKKSELDWQNEGVENCIFKTGQDFGTEYFIYQPYRTFIQMLPVIREVEDHTIVTTIGDFYKSFIASTPNTQLEKTLMQYLRRAVANLAIAKAIESLSVKITANGFTVRMGDDADDPNRSDKTAGISFLGADTQIEAKRKSAIEAGNKYLLQAKDLLDSNASADVFADYFNSTFYSAPSTTEQVDDNASRRIFVL